MWIEHDITHLKLERRSGITIGAFDGVHRGHRELIRQMVIGAKHRGMQSIVLTFDPLPGQVLAPDQYRLLSTLSERIACIGNLGVEGLVIVPFDAQFMETPASDFVSMLVDHLALGGLWVGPDFRLGKGREGDGGFLEQAGARAGFEVSVLQDTVHWNGKPVRSSRIRDALIAGDLETAVGCLGRPYCLSGTVGHGERRGRDLGYPTANLEVPEERLLPANGVYICRAHLGATSYHAIANVGTRPTFNHHPPNVEAHLLDFSGDIYGHAMRLDFLRRLRPELKFPSAEALIQQMRLDEAETRRWWQESGS